MKYQRKKRKKPEKEKEKKKKKKTKTKNKKTKNKKRRVESESPPFLLASHGLITFLAHMDGHAIRQEGVNKAQHTE
ncbi:hypothetical protein MY11210_004393 [Beauveria gryllotalpidicola]